MNMKDYIPNPFHKRSGARWDCMMYPLSCSLFEAPEFEDEFMCFLVVPNLPSGSGSCWENVSHYGLFCSISHAMR